MLRIHQVTQRQSPCILEPGVRIGIDLEADQAFDTLAGAESLLTEQETIKVCREQVEVIEHRACQPIDYRSRRVQNEHCGGVS